MLTVSKSPGPDNMHPHLLKNCADLLGPPENRNQPESTGIHRNPPESTAINRNQNEVYRNHTLNLRNQLPENRNQPESTEINKNQHQVYGQTH